jgi:acetolactate synthase-1/2/3 large subunit
MPQAASAARNTSSHALLSVFAANGIDRVYLVPGESYLGILDALNDFPQIDVLTCRHEAGAGFMACADGRLTRRPGLVLVSRGPGASNASIALHTAQQDAIPLILVIGQIPAKDLRKEAFQEIDYQKSFGSIAKWVAEATAPEQLAEIAFKAVRIATSGQPGPVVIVVPEDIQQQPVTVPDWVAVPNAPATATVATRERITSLMAKAERPLIIAGGGFDVPGGREALLALAEAWNIPVALSFRRHDLFPLTHRLYAGDLGLANPAPQMAAFNDSDLILALGTRLDDITSQGYTFPRLPKPAQTLVHCYPDDHIVSLHFAPDIALVADAFALARDLMAAAPVVTSPARASWAARLRGLYEGIAAWPVREARDGVDFAKVVRALAERAPRDMALCVDAGTFAAPVYRHFPFVPPQRLMAPLSGAMGYGTPAAVATQLRCPGRRVVAMVGDGGFLMTGNEMIAAVERKLPILFIVSNNNSYASIRIHQDAHYPGRHLGTGLFNPDFTAMARAFGMQAETVVRDDEIDAALERGLAATEPYFIEVRASLAVSLPKPQAR